MVKKTTAYYRKKGMEAEELLNFPLAKKYYKKAIENYPARIGQLAKADMDSLRRRIKDL